MKRNNDLIRDLMLHIEAEQKPPQPIFIEGLGNYDKHETYYHMQLLEDESFIETADNQDGMEKSGIYVVFRLTNAGHDFLDSIRDDTIWNKTKEKVASVGGGATLEVIKAVATAYVKEKLGIA